MDGDIHSLSFGVQVTNVLSAPLYFTLCDDFHCIWCFPTYGGSAVVILLEFQEVAMSLHCWCLLEVRMARVQ